MAAFEDRAADRTAAPRRWVRTYGTIGLGLLLLIPLTWGLWEGTARWVEASAADRQAAVVEQALAAIEDDFDALQQRLQRQARAVARHPAVVRGLREMQEARTETPEALVDYMAARSLPSLVAAEIFGLTPRVRAWNGYSMPPDAAADALPFIDTVRVSVAEDADWRTALAVWWPVRDGLRTVGAVRVMHLLERRTPVRNQYLRAYSMAETWTRLTGLAVDAGFGQAELDDGAAPDARHVRLLEGLDGTPVGWVRVLPPSTGTLISRGAIWYENLQALWATLLLVVLVAGVWRWFREASGGSWAGAARFAVVAAAWWGARYALLWLDVPARWQAGKAPLAPLFDPTPLASPLGGGLLRSTGDLLLTALFAVLFGVMALVALAPVRGTVRRRMQRAAQAAPQPPSLASRLRAGGLLVLWMALVTGLTALLARLVQRAALDSTLDYFARTGLLPEPLVLVVFAALQLLTIAAVLLTVALGWGLLRAAGPAALVPPRRLGWAMAIFGIVLAALAAILYGVPGAAQRVPPLSLAGLLLAGAVLTSLGLRHRSVWLEGLRLRRVLLGGFIVTVLLYPTFFEGMEARKRLQMVDAVGVLEEGRDLRLVHGIKQLLDTVQGSAAFTEATPDTADAAAARLDTTALRAQAAEWLRGSLLASLGGYDVTLSIFDTAGQPVARAYEGEQVLSASVLDEVDADRFMVVRQMYADAGAPGWMVESITGRREPDRVQYVGLAPLPQWRGASQGWVLVSAEPRPLHQQAGTPFPRVLLPTDYFDTLYGNLSVAAFRDGVLIRSVGRDFGRYRLDPEQQQAVLIARELWERETVKNRPYFTYYQRQDGPAQTLRPGVPAASPLILVVRAPALTTYDHLYYLLRLTVASLFIGLPLYLFGLGLRYRYGDLPARRTRFSDRILDAFLTVGLVTVALVGFVGLQVVTGENERAVQSWLRQHLERVEETLVVEAEGDELPYRALDRLGVDAIAARLGIDLTLYRDAELVSSSRPRLIADRLLDQRLPIEVVQALYINGFRFTYTDVSVGSLDYTAGFRALYDEQGQIRYVISVPTLPEQERLDEERARTVAYLFGALLVLLLVVMGTAALLARALAGPLQRLQGGLEAVGQSEFGAAQRALPVETRDELGELAQAFNEMQQQLADSRERLAQQERQLAWREMARQVAHEIKNPLTPMKLSVQHLRRAFDREQHPGGDGASSRRFGSLFERTTTTLIEQIEALVRIANDFSDFARLPQRRVERIDLNEIVGEAVALMQAETQASAGEEGADGAGPHVHLAADLYPEPLWLEADGEELRRVYINLIKNALQAMPEDRPGRVLVTTGRREHSPAMAESRVEDTGTGIPVELRSRIFEPNFSTKTSGTGLGLAIVRKSIEAMGGAIDFETEEEVGTTFVLHLPLAEAPAGGDGAQRPGATAAGEPTAEDESVS